MARVTMSDLIARVRRLTNDVGSTPIFDDDAVQEFLDARRLEVRRARLMASRNAAGEYLDYYAEYGNWEADAVLEDAGGNTLSPASSEWLVGHWSFSSSTPPPVFITGKVYDVYGAAADLLEAWAAKVALEFDFEADGGKFRRSQKREALLALAREYRRQAWPVMATMVRPDVADG